MHTLSGRRFEIGGSWSPTIKDVAFGLSRIPRWGGATLVPWTVLQHSLAAHRLAKRSPVALAILWHDVDEMATGDIPKPFKTPEQAALGERLRVWFFEATLGLPYPGEGVWDAVKLHDESMKIAEAHCFCHPRVRLDFPNLTVSDLNACDVIWDMFTVPVDDLIREFVEVTEGLVGNRRRRG